MIALPAIARAQTATKTPRIGLLTPNAPALAEQHFAGFVEGLRDLGYAEGRNIRLERRYASGRFEDFPTLAAALVRQPVDVIVAAGPHAIRAAKAATRMIPIVMAISHEPVAMGFIESLARPGGNVTGLAFQDSDLSTKRLELLAQAVPNLTRVVVLWEPAGGGSSALRATEQAAKVLGIKLEVEEVASASDIASALATAKRRNAHAVFQLASPLFSANRRTLSDLGLQHRLPIGCETPAFVEAGCFLAYGPNFSDMWRRAAYYVDRILKGARPEDLPVEQPTTFELVVNLRTAKALGLSLPTSLLERADRVIE